MRERVVRETERRLAGDVLAEALGGRLDADELRGRLRPFGIGAEAAVLVFELDDPHAAERRSSRARRRRASRALVATSAAAGRPLLCAVVDGAEPATRSRSRADAARGARRRRTAQVRAAASRALPRRLAAPRLPRGPLRARGDLARRRRRARGGVATQDLGAFTLLLSLQDDEALRLYCDSLLGADRGHRGRVRRRAAALARGLHRAQRELGAGGPRALLPPPHAALPDPQDRGADRARPVAGHRPDRALAARFGRGSWSR